MVSHNTTALVNEPTPVSRTSEWTCRLPKETLCEILHIQARSGDYNSLRTTQSTSSTIYLVTTPYLDHHLDLDYHSIPRLFNLFREIIRHDWQVLNEDLVDDKHPLDPHRFHRLRWALSFVKTIHVTPVVNGGMFPALIEDYTDICTALRVYHRPTLWSSLDSVPVHVEPARIDSGPYGRA